MELGLIFLALGLVATLFFNINSINRNKKTVEITELRETFNNLINSQNKISKLKLKLKEINDLIDKNTNRRKEKELMKKKNKILEEKIEWEDDFFQKLELLSFSLNYYKVGVGVLVFFKSSIITFFESIFKKRKDVFDNKSQYEEFRKLYYHLKYPKRISGFIIPLETEWKLMQRLRVFLFLLIIFILVLIFYFL